MSSPIKRGPIESRSINSSPIAALPCALALGLIFVAGTACDRRRSDPPERSSTTDSTQSARPGSGAAPGVEPTAERAACMGLSGQALADCQNRAAPAAPAATQPEPEPAAQPEPQTPPDSGQR